MGGPKRLYEAACGSGRVMAYLVPGVDASIEAAFSAKSGASRGP